MLRRVTQTSKPSFSNGNLKTALLEMASQGVETNFHGYDALLNECVEQRALREGQRVHAHMIKTRYQPPVYLRTRLIVFYERCDSLSDARRVFDEMPERNVVSWTAMISGYSRRGYAPEALNLFVQMLRSGTSPNEFTFATVLTSCTGAFGFNYGRQIHSHLIKNKFECHTYVGSSLLDVYAKSGEIHEARSVFESLTEHDLVCCTAIISGYAQSGLDEEALEMFRRLKNEGMSPNYVTYASLLNALSGLAAFELGKQVHNHILRSKQPLNVVLHNSLIDMYSKCGNLTYSRIIFDKMNEKTVISWNSMLLGYSKHGLVKEMLELFELMKGEGSIRPDAITFLAVITGCSHGGREDQGLKIFDEIVAPTIEHYGCVVDLLGRAGRVEKAFDFIKKMPFEPTPAVWGSLLGACRAHSNVEIGEIAGSLLIQIEPENSGNYVILSNLYAHAGRWEKVRTIREVMNEKAVKKEAGKSWIEIDKTLYTFHAGDQSHSRKEEIFEKVRELSDKIKERGGYVPDLSCVLHDVDDEQKERILLGHSEKLAMAFGMIRGGGNNKPIRVMKNLRICVDCHNFAKGISGMYGVEICLRDKSRFHRIVDGICSCGDYW